MVDVMRKENMLYDDADRVVMLTATTAKQCAVTGILVAKSTVVLVLDGVIIIITIPAAVTTLPLIAEINKWVLTGPLLKSPHAPFSS